MLRHKFDVLDRHCREIGRDPSEITKTAFVMVPDDLNEFRTQLESLAEVGVEGVVVIGTYDSARISSHSSHRSGIQCHRKASTAESVPAFPPVNHQRGRHHHKGHKGERDKNNDQIPHGPPPMGVAMVLLQSSRPLDVGEEEGDGARRQLGHPDLPPRYDIW